MSEHKLRVYKHAASGYTDILSSSQGGFQNLELTWVRNDAGSLRFDLAATTPAMFHSWLDEASRVELWEDSSRLGIYHVDAYAPRWSALSCSVDCTGILASTKDAPFSGGYTNATAMQVLSGLVAAAPGITWVSGSVSVPSGTVSALSYVDRTVYDGIAELATLFGFDFWVDGDGVFCTAPHPTTTEKTFTLNDDSYEFDTSYSARDIVNRLILTTDSGVWAFDDLTSQGVYGIHQQRVSVTGIVSKADAEKWATNVFALLAYPIQRITIETDHAADNLPGKLVEVVGLGDGRTYLDKISQVTWSLGDLTDNVQIGHQPPALKPPGAVAGVNGLGGNDGIPGLDSLSGGGMGIVTGVHSNLVDITFGGGVETSMPFLTSYTPQLNDVVVWLPL